MLYVYIYTHVYIHIYKYTCIYICDNSACLCIYYSLNPLPLTPSSPEASQDVRRAYRDLARRWHPDKHQNRPGARDWYTCPELTTP